MARAKSTAVTPLNLGLYYGRNPLDVPPQALRDGRNFRIRRGKISNLQLGWAKWSPQLGTNDSFTKILLHFEAADGSTIIHDSAAGQNGPPWRVWSANGGASIDTAQFLFGEASLLLDGINDDISTPDNAAFTLGASNFRIFSGFNCNTAGGTIIGIASQRDAAATAAASAWQLYRRTDNKIEFDASDGSNFVIGLISTSTFTNAVNTGWHKVEIVRIGSTWQMKIDGVVEATTTLSITVNDSAQDVHIGSLNTGAFWGGWIDEFSLSIGGAYVLGNNNVKAPFQRTFNGPVMLIEEFVSRGQVPVHVIATTRDIYSYNPQTDVTTFISPQFNTGTVNVSNATPAVVTVNTGTPLWVTNGIKPGDQIIFNTNAENAPEAAWYEIAAVNSNTQLTLTTAVTNTPFTNVSYAIRRRFTGDTTDRWDVETFVAPNDGTGNDMMFLTNGLEDVVTWTVQEFFSVFRTSLGFKAKQLRIFKSMMLYGNLTIAGVEKPTTFINSDVGIPLAVVGGLSGQFRVHDGVDVILEMEDLGDNMVFYSERHLTLMQFVGDPLIFIFRQASTGIGPLGPELVADFGDYHEFIGADSQYLFDGVSVTEVGTQVWREVLRARDASRQTLGFNHFDEENGDLIWAIPQATDVGIGSLTSPPEEAFVEHYLEIEGEKIPDPVSRRAMPFVCGGFAQTSTVLIWSDILGTWAEQTIQWNDSTLGAAFPLNLMGGNDGFIYVINVSQFGNGAILPSFIAGGRRAIVDGKNRGLVKRIYPFATQLTGNLQVITKYSDHASGPVTSSETNLMDLSLPQEGHFVTPYRRGRFVETEFRRDDGQAYELEGYDIDGIPGGKR